MRASVSIHSPASCSVNAGKGVFGLGVVRSWMIGSARKSLFAIALFNSASGLFAWMPPHRCRLFRDAGAPAIKPPYLITITAAVTRTAPAMMHATLRPARRRSGMSASVQDWIMHPADLMRATS